MSVGEVVSNQRRRRLGAFVLGLVGLVLVGAAWAGGTREPLDPFDAGNGVEIRGDFGFEAVPAERVFIDEPMMEAGVIIDDEPAIPVPAVPAPIPPTPVPATDE